MIACAGNSRSCQSQLYGHEVRLLLRSDASGNHLRLTRDRFLSANDAPGAGHYRELRYVSQRLAPPAIFTV